MSLLIALLRAWFSERAFPLIAGILLGGGYVPINFICRFSVPICILPIFIVPWQLLFGRISQRDFKGAACYSFDTYPVSRVRYYNSNFGDYV